MTVLARAWEAAITALTEAHDIASKSGDVDAIEELLQHASDMIDQIDVEIREGRIAHPYPTTMRMAAAQLRLRLEATSALMKRAS